MVEHYSHKVEAEAHHFLKKGDQKLKPGFFYLPVCFTDKAIQQSGNHLHADVDIVWPEPLHEKLFY